VPYCASCGGFHADDAAHCPYCGAAVGDTPRAPAYAGFWRRAGGFVLDTLVIQIPAGVLTDLFGGSGASSTSTTNPVTGATSTHLHIEPFRFAVTSLFGFVVAWLYYALLQSSSWRATVGQRAVGVHVTDLDGNRISFARASGREFASILSGLIFGIGYLMIIWTERKQALHDMLASTLVVRNPD
jgi:uncharacterized RDD family membrane protein YckC